jgi:hypothetical protein
MSDPLNPLEFKFNTTDTAQHPGYAVLTIFNDGTFEIVVSAKGFPWTTPFLAERAMKELQAQGSPFTRYSVLPAKRF